ncbi:branched-subunit amino acid ABC-type transport system permease component [Asanoa ferruginea]|uniref:Branched-subunit amino acid ABC-type transport system permease component n=1 Tax=Asanoa ferruginea TaxID=53367 RepID=A0A3D9ZDK7_9ACTN|nr:hypothetical protein [Asanoa ferruginea]REF95337.1 branched-subunit amino acid ABC-type transport system permease component [Asanoa ferruginea]
MAYRTWGRVLLAALVVGLLAGAGQLGFAYGLGVVRFSRDFEQLSGQWTAHLAWVAWFAMLAAVAGGLAGNWLARRDGLPATIGERVAVAVAGGVGALAVAPLAMLPARAATTGDGNPVAIAGLSAALGALVGVFAALAVLSQRVAGLNLGAVTLVVWLVALLSVAPSLGPDDPLPEVRLGVLDATWLGDSLAQRLAVIVMPAIALAVGAGIGALARWRGLPMIPVAVSGVVGPALLALAYLIAGPGNDADRYQAAPYWGALIAVAAGGLGSVLASVARQLTAGGGAAAPAAGPGPRHGGDHTAEVFPSYGGSASESWSSEKPDSATGSFGREPDKDLFGNPRHEQREPGDASFTGFGRAGSPSDPDSDRIDERDPLGGGASFTGFGSGPARGSDRDALGSPESDASFGGAKRDALGSAESGASFTSFGGTKRDPLGSAERDASFTSFGGAKRDPLGSAERDASFTSFGDAERDPLGSAEGDASFGSFGGAKRDPLGSAEGDASFTSFGGAKRDPLGSAEGDASFTSFGGGEREPLGSAEGDASFGGARSEPLGSAERDASSTSFGGAKRDPLGSAEGDASFASFGGGEREPRGGERDRLTGAASGGFGSGEGDPLGMSGSAGRDPLGAAGGGGPGAGRGRSGAEPRGGTGARSEGVAAPSSESAAARRARDLSDMERSTAPRVGDGKSPSAPARASLFNPPTPVAPPRQPEVVSPPPGPEPTPIRPFERQSTPGPGDWRTDRTSTFPASSVPVVPASPASGSERRDDGDLHSRPTSIRPQPPAPGAIPRQPGRGEPEQAGQAAGTSWASRADQGASQPGGEMPDWRLAPPAWTPPPPVTPGSDPAAGPSAPPVPARDAAPAAEAAPAKAPEQKRRGLFRRKNKSEPTPVAEAADSGWVDVPSAGGPGSGSEQPTTGDPTPSGPRGFGFGGLVTSRFGGGDDRSDRDPTDSGSDLGRRGDAFGRPHDADGLGSRDSSAPDSGGRDSGGRDSGGRDRQGQGSSADGFAGRDSGARGRDTDSLAARDSGAHDLGARDSGARDRGAGLGTSGLGAANRSRNSWDTADDTDRPPADPATTGRGASRSRPSWDPAATSEQDQGPTAARSRTSWDTNGPGRQDTGTPSAGRGSWDPAGQNQPAPADDDRGTGRKAGRAQRHLHSVDLGSDDGSWDIDDAPARSTPTNDDNDKADEADSAETASPSRGLFRRNRNNTAESTDPAPDAPADQPRGKRGKGDKPIRERDEEYVDWVTGLSAPEPVNERRRDETPRRSLRSTTRQKDE